MKGHCRRLPPVTEQKLPLQQLSKNPQQVHYQFIKTKTQQTLEWNLISYLLVIIIWIVLYAIILLTFARLSNVMSELINALNCKNICKVIIAMQRWISA